MSKEAMKLALEALENIEERCTLGAWEDDAGKAITALREALAEQPAQQEPVATLFGSLPVYDTSPPAQRKPLTDDELADLWYKQSLDWMEFARAIEAAHGIKEKNA